MEAGNAKRQGCSNDVQSTHNFLVTKAMLPTNKTSWGAQRQP
jgi:hypothetical protein